MTDYCEVPPNKKPRSKPKVVKEWDEEEVFKLILLVEGESCLWDASDESYHNKILRDLAWENISENFAARYTTADLMAKWTNLRIQFRGYASRAKTKSGQGAVEAPKWKYFNAMGFVGRAEKEQSQPTISNLVLEIESDSNSIDCPSPLTTQQKAATPRKAQVANTQSAATQIAETMREAVVAMRERNQNVFDPNISFCNYLVSELKTLTDDAAAFVRKKVSFFFLQCLEEERK